MLSDVFRGYRKRLGGMKWVNENCFPFPTFKIENTGAIKVRQQEPDDECGLALTTI